MVETNEKKNNSDKNKVADGEEKEPNQSGIIIKKKKIIYDIYSMILLYANAISDCTRPYCRNIIYESNEHTQLVSMKWQFFTHKKEKKKLFQHELTTEFQFLLWFNHQQLLFLLHFFFVFNNQIYNVHNQISNCLIRSPVGKLAKFRDDDELKRPGFSRRWVFGKCMLATKKKIRNACVTFLSRIRAITICI